MLIAVAVVSAGLLIVGLGRQSYPRLVAGGVFTGTGVASMHYTGMAAMRMSATMTYSVPLLALSLVIAIVAFVLTATIALSPNTLEIREDQAILDLARSRGLQV